MEGVVLETERLVLRRLTLDDAGFIVGLLNEPSFLRFIGDRGVRNEEQARAYLRDGPLASYAQHGFGLYLAVRKEDGVPLGMCGLLRREALDDPDVGFALKPAYWSQGYAYEAARAVLDYGRDTLGLRHIVAIVAPDNEALRMSARKAQPAFRAHDSDGRGGPAPLRHSHLKRRGPL
ncbi:MAG TPA: GNAT family N-acetyltransferase [Rhodothermales bacterium]|nr:GNAT family N-acetyltransferase [Rhodothermales bacterium]